MRDAGTRVITLIAAVLLTALLCCAALAQGSLVWPSYHFDNNRLGQNSASKDIANPGSTRLVWVFPRGVGGVVNEDFAIVDDLETLFVSDFTHTGSNTDEAWLKNFWYTKAVSNADTQQSTKRMTATWQLPPSRELPLGSYRVEIWVPPVGASRGDNTTRAFYTVHDDLGTTTIRFNQQDRGWQPLGDRTFQFGIDRSRHKIVLSNITGDTVKEIEDGAASGNTLMVVADAIRLVPNTGKEIYTSPASASWMWSTGIPAQDQFLTAPTPFAYIGAVEAPFVDGASATDTGAVYCINSVTPTIRPLSSYTGTPEEDAMNALAEHLGTAEWSYPDYEKMGTWTDTTGPIMGGVFASPTLAYITDNTLPEGKRLVCFVSGMDMQTYALDGKTGQLLWKGPGVTLGEGTPPGWTEITSRRDAFGSRFHWIECVDTSNANIQKVIWNFTPELRRQGGEPEGALRGWSYSVYAWIPVHLPTDLGGKARVRDAVYTIKYEKYDAGSAAVTAGSVDITVDQSIRANQGKWVRLGSSYFNVTSVELANTTKQATPADYAAVADAIMIVPDTIGAFGYCTPATDSSGPASNASTVYAVNGAGGRILAFDVNPQIIGSGIGRVKWIYPDVRSKLIISDPSDQDASPMGEIGASPAFIAGGTDGNRLIISSFSESSGPPIPGVPADAGGVVRCVGNLQGTPKVLWTFPNSVDSGNGVIPAGFSSSTAVDISRNQLFIPSVGGVMYCLHTDTKPNGSQLKWRWPDEVASPGTAPMGRCEFSTPVVADVNGVHRVYVGSTDGRVYSFHASDTVPGGERRIWVEYKLDPKTGEISQTIEHGGLFYFEPSVFAPIQGSVAFDAGLNGTGPPTMFFGDMNGSLHWHSAQNGSSDWRNANGSNIKGWRTEGKLFSSPNITHARPGGGATKDVSWVYVGCGDGRMYAFTHGDGAWGGRWAGGDWPFEGTSEGESQTEVLAAPNTEIQLDMFDVRFFDNSNKRNPEPKISDKFLVEDASFDPPDATKWPDDWTVGEDMKLFDSTTLGTKDGDVWDDAIDDELRKFAKKRRKGNYLAGGDAGARARVGDTGYYFEWGENIYLVLWNLPGLDFLNGSTTASKQSGIRWFMTNASPGESGGSTLKLAGVTQVLKQYTVLDKEKKHTEDIGGKSVTHYDPLKYKSRSSTGGSLDVRRCYAIAKIEIKPNSSRPASPGPGWIITCEVTHKTDTGSGSTFVKETIPVGKLKIGKDGAEFEPLYVPSKQGGVADTPKEQQVGINNPLAITTKPGDAAHSLAWPALNDWSTVNKRFDPEAHFNGNAAYTGTGGYSGGKLPTIDMGPVSHGRGSGEFMLHVMDRSATGTSITSTGTPLRTMEINLFRVNAEDLRWRGGDGQISSSGGVRFPWEMGSGSVDYPHIYRRYQNYRKLSDDVDPSRQRSTLPPVILTADDTFPQKYNTEYGSTATTAPRLRPEQVSLTVEVPRFQPANAGDGYSRILEAFVDSDDDGNWDGGTRLFSRPETYQEAHRRFGVRLAVPPDPRIEVQEQLIDVGRAPHGLGDYLSSPLDYYPANASPLIQNWFKVLTVKNAGNVNLKNMRVGKDVPLLSDQANPKAPLPGSAIVSSLDGYGPPAMTPFWLYEDKGSPLPFVTKNTDGELLGYTLSKPRVGDPDPTILTIPDRRKWDYNFAFAATNAMGIMQAFGWPTADNPQPMSVMVGVRVPLSQPIGTYQAPFVPVFSDTNNNGIWDRGTATAPGEPGADPSFQLKVTVRESQLTGGVTPTSLPQVDVPPSAPDELPRVGDSSPAAFRDKADGSAYMFWSSNRMVDPASPAELTNAPWFINRAKLEWQQRAGWMPEMGANGGSAVRWWQTPPADPGLGHWLPSFQWPAPMAADIMKWKDDLYSVRHHSPVIGENLPRVEANPADERNLHWLAWIGDANKLDPNTNKVSQDHLIFYTDASHGNVTGQGSQINAIEHDKTMAKRSPSMSVYGNNMWMFWQGGESGRWSIYYSTNNNGPTFPVGAWTADTRLRTPDCLSTVSSPDALHRVFWRNMDSDATDYDNPTNILDVVYAGTGKLTQNADIIMSRYAAIQGGNATMQRFAPGRRALPLPRVFGEKLQRDAKYGFFTSKHLAWTRLDTGRVSRGEQKPVVDNWGGYDVADPNADLPFVHVVLPKGYNDGSKTWANGAVVSGTDGSIYEVDATGGGMTLVVQPVEIMPEIDAATGICTYKYPDPQTKAILGDMLVDFSAGIVRFTTPLKELVDRANNSVKAPEVFADYTPLSWRLTTDAAGDTSPRAFIERTRMDAATPVHVSDANPGLCNFWKDKAKSAPVDRMWVFWRKAGTGIESSTIFYATYRIGVDITKLLDKDGKPCKPIKWDHNGFDEDMVQGNMGAWEVDRLGKRIYFTGVDERYRSLAKSDTPGAVAAVFGTMPDRVTVKYTNIDGDDQTVYVDDIFWINELPEQSLFGFAADSNVNEGSIHAFADPEPTSGTLQPIPSSKIWVFWTSTRGGNSDLFWETISPDFSAR